MLKSPPILAVAAKEPLEPCSCGEICGVMWVCFVGFIDEFCSACTAFLGGVAIFSHESEQEVEEFVGWFWEVF